MSLKTFLLTFLFLNSTTLFGQEAEKEEKKEAVEPPKVGNFSLPGSQLPSGLIGFGGNILDQKEVQFKLFADQFIGDCRYATDFIPFLIFGVTDYWSISFKAPFTPGYKNGRNHSSGLEDFAIQTEYAFWSKKTYCYVDQATVVVNVSVPTGSANLVPSTGFGAPSLFLGATYYRTMIDWIIFTSQGATLTGCENGTKFGDQFFYQGGLGRNFCSPDGWIYAWMVEVDGQYNKKDKIFGVIDPNSGGNVIYVTPSLWVSKRHFLMQFGMSFPVNQNLFGNQRKYDFAFVFNIGWSFYNN